MIVIGGPNTKLIMDLFDGKQVNGINYKFEKKVALFHYFSHDGEVADAASSAKKFVRTNPSTSAMNISVKQVDDKGNIIF